MINEKIMIIRLNNGITYTKNQVRGMFPSQIETIKKYIIPEDKKILKMWLNGDNRE